MLHIEGVEGNRKSFSPIPSFVNPAVWLANVRIVLSVCCKQPNHNWPNAHAVSDVITWHRHGCKPSSVLHIIKSQDYLLHESHRLPCAFKENHRQRHMQCMVIVIVSVKACISVQPGPHHDNVASIPARPCRMVGIYDVTFLCRCRSVDQHKTHHDQRDDGLKHAL